MNAHVSDGPDELSGALEQREHEMTMTIDPTVEVVAFQDSDDELLLSLLNELRSFATKVRVERYPPDAGGPNEIFFVLSIVGTGVALYLKSFLETLGAEHAKALNSYLINLLKSGNGKTYQSGTYPLRVGGERIWFHLRGPVTTKELRRRMRLAAEEVAHLTKADFDDSISSGQEYCYYWNEDLQSWEIMPEGEYGPKLPENAG